MRPQSLFRTAAVLAAALPALAGSFALVTASSPKFFDDDPIRVERDTQDASGLRPVELNLFVEMARGVLERPAAATGRRAMNVNTVDEVPDSSWYTNRGQDRPLTVAAVERGPDTSDGPAAGTWTIVASKTDGTTPGFTIRDSRGEIWFLKVDPPGYPGMATGTEVAVTKLMWALGYNVPENHIATLRRENLTIDAGARLALPDGRKRAMRGSDIDGLLRRAHRNDDGTYRVVASRRLPGIPVGRIRFEGTRPDDPNDIVPHEHRRELRGYRVFAAWVNHVDAKPINSMDTLIEDEGGAYVRHHLVDFGSALGSGGVRPAEYWAGSEHLVDVRQVGRQILGFGLSYPAWHTAPFHEAPAIGRFPLDNESFDPDAWKPRVPNAAFGQARADDKFWAARRLMTMRTELIRAAVHAGRFGDEASEAFLVRALADRRDAIGRAYLTAVNPIVDPALDETGTLTFGNAAVDGDFARAPAGYRAVWARFDNATGAVDPIAETTSRSTSMKAPANLPAHEGAFVRVELSAVGAEIAAWEEPVIVYFRLRGDVWQLVGFERMPDRAAA